MNRLRTLRKKMKLSGKELGNELGYAESTILQWERGIRQPDLTGLTTLANFFHVSVDYLLGRTDFDQILLNLEEYQKNAFTLVPLYEEYDWISNPKQISDTPTRIKIPFVMMPEEDKEVFAIYVKDHQMSPTLKKNDLVIATVGDHASHNDIVLVKKDDTYFYARVKEVKANIFLSFDQLEADLIELRFSGCKIVAKVVELHRRIL